jgi:hypothetical protein
MQNQTPKKFQILLVPATPVFSYPATDNPHALIELRSDSGECRTTTTMTWPQIRTSLETLGASAPQIENVKKSIEGGYRCMLATEGAMPMAFSEEQLRQAGLR